jgi:KDO2-lipid IV(A) lauroyltransferase
MAKYWLFRLATMVVPRVPAALAYRAAIAAGLIFWALAPSLRRRAAYNLRHVPGLAADPHRLHRAVRDVFYHSVLNYLDFLRGAHLGAAQILASVTAEGEEAFDAIMAEGRGLVLLTAHLSGFEAGASRLGAKGFRVVAPVERMRPEALFQLFCRMREHHGFHFLPADSRETLRALMAAVKDNGIAVFAVDRYVTGASERLPFFGAPARMPTTPAALALRLGVPVALAFTQRAAPQRIDVTFVPVGMPERESPSAPSVTSEPAGAREGAAVTSTARTPQASTLPAAQPLQPTPGRPAAPDAPAGLQRLFLAHLERHLRAHPEQWVSALTPVWEA